MSGVAEQQRGNGRRLPSSKTESKHRDNSETKLVALFPSFNVMEARLRLSLLYCIPRHNTNESEQNVSRHRINFERTSKALSKPEFPVVDEMIQIIAIRT